MTAYKIVFLIVIGLVALLVAWIVAGMFADKQTLPNGYEISVGGKGETWVQSRDRQTLVTDVTSVWSAPDRILIERRTLAEAPPYGYRDCDYLTAGSQGPLRPISKAQARVVAGGMALATGSSRSCLAKAG